MFNFENYMLLDIIVPVTSSKESADINGRNSKIERQ